MKKLLLLLSLVCIRQVYAQCPITVTGGSVCAGSCATLTANGALTYQWLPFGETTSTISACTYNTSYTVTGYGTGGCISQQIINLSIAIPPYLSVTSVDASCPTCNDGQISATTASGNFPLTFTWSPTGAVAESGSTSIYSNALPGTYTVCVSDANGCTDCASANVNLNVTGINISSTNAQVSVYPNPTSDQFFIDANTTDKLITDLYDINGRHLFSETLSDKSNINVATLDNGIYTLTIKTGDRIINKKLIILR